MYSIETFPVGSYQANCYLLESNGQTLVIDPGDEPDTILKALEGREVVGILLTHSHSDHIGAVNEVVEATGAPVIIAEADVPGLTDQELSGFQWEGREYRVEQVDRILREGDVVKWGDDELVVLATPGHTPGSLCFYDEAAERMFTGDTIFAGAIGRTDFPGGNQADMVESCKRLGTYPSGITLFPGHGPQTNMGVEKQRNPWLGAGA